MFENPPQVRMSRRQALGGATGILAWRTPSFAWAQNEGIGQVESLRGEAFAESAGDRRRLDLQAPIFIGDIIITGASSRIAVRLGRRTRLALGENARLRVDQHIMASDRGTYELQAGPLLVEHDQGGPAVPATVRSPYALIAVRGTRFFAGPSNDAFGVFVATGGVSVQAAARLVVLAAGEGTSIARPGDPPGKVVAWGEARIRAALASVR